MCNREMTHVRTELGDEAANRLLHFGYVVIAAHVMQTPASTPENRRTATVYVLGMPRTEEMARGEHVNRKVAPGVAVTPAENSEGETVEPESRPRRRGRPRKAVNTQAPDEVPSPEPGQIIGLGEKDPIKPITSPTTSGIGGLRDLSPTPGR